MCASPRPTPANDDRSFHGVRRLVVKVGSGVLASRGRLSLPAVTRLAADLSRVAAEGRQVVLVSSGAVASGFRRLGLRTMPRTIVEKQAAAAVGQQRLMHAYAEAFEAHDRAVGQVLLTADDLHHRQRFLNARHTLDALLRAGVVPIVNENDSVSFDEIKLGDNDNLSALVANVVGADLLVMLTTVSGVLSAETGRVIPRMARADEALAHIGSQRSTTGVGGMTTKIQAARTATSMGIATIIADGRAAGQVQRILAGRRIGTFFPAGQRSAAARKRWIGFAARVKGSITVDAGAAAAIARRGASLLPSGIVTVRGPFEAGATVSVLGPDGTPLARGIACYSDTEIDRVKGRRTGDIQSILGYAYSDEIIHRNDMLLTPHAATPSGGSAGTA